MKQSDVKYYVNQINTFTAFIAIEGKNSFSVDIDGEKKLIKTEDDADTLYRELADKSMREK